MDRSELEQHVYRTSEVIQSEMWQENVQSLITERLAMSQEEARAFATKQFDYFDAASQEMLRSMPTEAGQVNETARTMVNLRDSSEKQKKATKAASDKHKAVIISEKSTAGLQRLVRIHMGEADTSADYAAEEKLCENKLAAIDAMEEAALEEATSHYQKKNVSKEVREERVFRIKMLAQNDRLDAITKYARSLPLDSPKRLELLQKREEAILKLGALKHDFKNKDLTGTAALNQYWSDTKHAVMDMSKEKKRKNEGINPLSIEGAQYINPENGHILVNVGRATMGGTKPMYYYEDRSEVLRRENGKPVYQIYLFKEAINCMGSSTPERACVTEEAARLSDYIKGYTPVPSFRAELDGNVIGSFQKKMDTLSSDAADSQDFQVGAETETRKKVDLFAWQKTENRTELDKVTVTQLLQEHSIDWLLANFDTKGENFLQKEDYKLVALDKEASFSGLMKDETQIMSYTYKPHGNDSIYNVIFQEFISGKMSESMDFDVLEATVEKMESCSDADYINMFRGYLDQKYPVNPDDDATIAKRQFAESRILFRKNSLRQQYKIFFGDLIIKNLTARGLDPSTDSRLGEGGKYLFPSERVKKLEENSAYRRQIEAGVPTAVHHNDETDEKWITRTAVEKTFDKSELALASNNIRLAKLDIQSMDGAGVYAVQKGLKERKADSKTKEQLVEQMKVANKTALSRAEKRANEQTARQDGISNVVGGIHKVIEAQFIERKREDMTGTIRDEHVRKNEALSLEQVKNSKLKTAAETDVDNLHYNLYMDQMLEIAISGDAPEIMREDVELNYLQKNYISVAEAVYATSSVHAVAYKERREYSNRCNVMQDYTMNVKQFATGRYLEVVKVLCQLKAMEQTIEILSKEHNTGYELYMLEVAANRKKELEQEYNRLTAESIYNPKQFSNIDGMRRRYNCEIMRKHKDQLKAYNTALMELDKKESLTAEEADHKRELIEGLLVFIKEISVPGDDLSVVQIKKNQIEDFMKDSKPAYVNLSQENKDELVKQKGLFDSAYSSYEEAVQEFDRIDELVFSLKESNKDLETQKSLTRENIQTLNEKIEKETLSESKTRSDNTAETSEKNKKTLEQLAEELANIEERIKSQKDQLYQEGLNRDKAKQKKTQAGEKICDAEYKIRLIMQQAQNEAN